MIICLGVWEQNRKATEFYETWGFRTVRTGLFSLGDDILHALLMTRPVMERTDAERQAR